MFDLQVKTKEVSLTGVSVVSNYALLLFGGPLRLDSGANGTAQLSMLNGNYTFRSDPEAAELVQSLRQELHNVLMRKIECPSLDMVEAGGPVLQAVLELLQNEHRIENPTIEMACGSEAAR